ncbi:MAG: alpha/beta hydrolase [Actinomycetota bacterium]|nr:alpha/beta hydrolase [Actinomycetota bacterium]
MWHRVLPVLRTRGVQALVVKRSESSMTAPHTDARKTAESDVAQVLAEQGTAVVVGYGLGASTALAMAASAPHRVRALVLIAPAAGLQPIGIADRLLAAPVAGPVVACIGFRLVALALQVPALRRRILVTRGGLCASNAEHAVHHLASRSTWRTFLSAQRRLVSDHQRRYDQLGRIACPIVIVDGAYDRAVTRRIGATVRRLLPGAELVSSSAAGHLIPLDDPDSVADAILRALRREYRNSLGGMDVSART